MSKLNVGCGRNIIEGWINLDSYPLPGVDVVADLEKCSSQPLPFADESIDEFLLSHVIEHISNVLPLMQELWRIAKPGARLVSRTPYGSSDDAFEDPTHVRPYFLHSYRYFSQPLYWRADYGYRGDWRAERVTLYANKQENAGLTPDQILEKVISQRNVVLEMVAELVCVKPAREPKLELQVDPTLEIKLV